MEKENGKIQWVKAELTEKKQFVFYSAIGVLGMVVDYTLFLLLFNAMGFEKNLANIIAMFAGNAHNFLWNALANFKTRDKLFTRYFSYLSIGIVGLGITTVLFFILIDQLGIDTNIVKAGSLVIVVIVQYNLNKKFSFRALS